MSSDMPGRPPGGVPTMPDDLRSDVLDILSDAVQWRLPAARWEGVEKLVQALHYAIKQGDSAKLEEILGDLELAAPLRITPIGGEQTTPATSKLRNIAAGVVHDLGQGIGSDSRGPGDNQRDEDDASDATSR
ncbi:CATRA system-associated protein [Amycolatopsis sp. NPDC051758]|uniref:CATRA system-associated protein n=1 Tax=Amycolatopsis sp. NPDC051758 TaxID=3363935 RepID=UPI0037926045